VNKTLLCCYIQSIFAIFINGYDILVAEVGSCVSSAGNTVATDFFAGP
jgi:hypothetical protein